MIDADLVIVGGGPVGLAAAIEARLAGLSVIVVEQRDGAIDKACGEGLMPGAVPLLERLGVYPSGMPLRGVSYRSANRHADYRFRNGEGRGVRRLELHTALSSRAASLGVQFEQAKVDSVTQDAGGVTIGVLRSAWAFGADGLHSSVRRLVGLESSARGIRRYGLRQHYRVAPWTDLIEVHWTPDVEVYVTPVAPDTVGVAILGRQGLTMALPRELKARLVDATPASSTRGAGPLRQLATAPSRGRVLLLGDASGYVDAITGEGLRLGFEQARVAVAAVTGGPAYDPAWRRVTRDFRMLTSGLVRAAGSPLRGAIVPAALRLPRVYGGVLERLAR